MSVVTDWLDTGDGVRLRYGRWPRDDARAVAVVLTGRNEFIEKYEEVAAELGQRGFEVWTMDWRGQGMSYRALPQRQRGHVASFVYYLADLRAFLRLITTTRPDLPRIILAHSMGGHVALRYLHDFPDAVTAAVLTAPMVDIKTRNYPPSLVRLVARLGVTSRLGRHYAPGMHDYDPNEDQFETNENTSDRDRFQRRVGLLANNPYLHLGGVTYGWLDAAFRSIAQLSRPAYLKAITTPLLVFAAAADGVVNAEAVARTARDLPNCQLVTLDGSRHEVMHENDRIRGEFWQHTDAFLDAYIPRKIPRQRRPAALR